MVDSVNEIIDTPGYTYNPETGLFTNKEQMLVNTAEFTRTAQYFKKHGVYTKAHPVYDEKEYKEFWKEERRRRIEGYSVGGVHITGEHYGFLNFNQILRVDEEEDDGFGVIFKNRKKKSTKKEMAFPDVWDGHIKWYNAKIFAREIGLHVIGGKARRKGFSYVGAWSCADKYDLYPNMTTILGAYDNKYLIKGDGTMAMAKKCLDFLNKHTAWKKRRLINLRDHVKSGYKIRGQDEEYGFLSQIYALSFGNNPDAAIGKDAYEVNLEELGRWPNLEDTLDVTLPAMEDGDYITGQLIGWGTGGTKDANWEVFEKIFYNPTAYGFLACDNVFEEESKGTPIGFWFPYTQNLVGHYDNDGNSNYETANKAADAKYEKIKQSKADPARIQRYIAQRAKYPSQAFSRSTVNIFTSPELTDWIKKVETDPNIKYLGRDGQFIYVDGSLKFVTNDQLLETKHKVHPFITSVPHKPGDDNYGCFRMWQPPFRIDGVIPKNLYRIWVDPVAHDKNKEYITAKDSLCSMYVYERPNVYTPTRGDIIVGSFTGRPDDLDDFNEIVIRAAYYYGGYDGIILFENDRGTLKEYARQKKVLHLLADEPDMVWKKEVQSEKTGRDKGIMITPKRKGIGLVYEKDWLYEIRGTNQDGTPKRNLHYIYDLPLLLEYSKHNLKGNFDRISAKIVGQYDMREQAEKLVEVNKKPSPDNFFNRPLFT